MWPEEETHRDRSGVQFGSGWVCVRNQRRISPLKLRCGGCFNTSNDVFVILFVGYRESLKTFEQESGITGFHRVNNPH